MSVEEVFKAAPGCQKVLMAALEACRTPRTPSELDSIMDEVLRCNRSVYRPAELRALLERYGALAYEPSEEEQAAQAALETGGEPELVVDEDGNFVTTGRSPKPALRISIPILSARRRRRCWPRTRSTCRCIAPCWSSPPNAHATKAPSTR